MAKTSPIIFRHQLTLPSDPPVEFRDQVQKWQREDFLAMDAAWKRLANVTGTSRGRRFRSDPCHPHRETIEKPIYQRAYIERPRGHSKTSDMAIQIAWILLYAKRSLRGLAAAADRDQATLILQAVQQLARANPELCGDLVFQRHLVINPQTDSRLEILSSDVQSSWGALPDFVICDELCHWEKPDLWFSLVSSAAKKPQCVLVVLTNAGVGRGWQWEVRETARESSDWYFASLDGPHAPWISERWLTEQQRLLPRPVYERLWLNRWQHSDGEFITLGEAEACRDESLRIREHGLPQHQYIAAIDYAEKHDYTVGVVIHEEGNRYIVDRMDVVTPQPGSPVRIAWVDRWIERMAKQFPNITFVLDEYQLLSTIQKYESRYALHRFEFLAGRGNHALAVRLRQLIIHREIVWPSGCGQLAGVEHRDDLETELASLILKQTASGRVRIDHLNDGQHHDDRAFALGAACLFAAQNHPATEQLHIAPPLGDGFDWGVFNATTKSSA